MSVDLIARLANLWKGFVSLWLTDVESKHPEIAYENAINSMIEKYAKLKSATAALIRRRQDIDARFGNATAELAQVSADLDVAVSTNQDDLAIVLIQKKNALETLIADITREKGVADKDAETAKSSLTQVKAEIEALKAEKDRMLAQMNSADARLRIQNQLEGLSVDAEVKALSNVRDAIKNRVAEANLGDELRENDVDNRLNKLRQSSGAIMAKSQLEALKQARKAAQASTNNGKAM